MSGAEIIIIGSTGGKVPRAAYTFPVPGAAGDTINNNSASPATCGFRTKADETYDIEVQANSVHVLVESGEVTDVT